MFTHSCLYTPFMLTKHPEHCSILPCSCSICAMGSSVRSAKSLAAFCTIDSKLSWLIAGRGLKRHGAWQAWFKFQISHPYIPQEVAIYSYAYTFNEKHIHLSQVKVGICTNPSIKTAEAEHGETCSSSFNCSKSTHVCRKSHIVPEQSNRLDDELYNMNWGLLSRLSHDPERKIAMGPHSNFLSASASSSIVGPGSVRARLAGGSWTWPDWPNMVPLQQKAGVSWSIHSKIGIKNCHFFPDDWFICRYNNIIYIHIYIHMHRFNIDMRYGMWKRLNLPSE